MINYDKILKDYDLNVERIKRLTVVNYKETAQEKKERIKRLEKSYAKWFEWHFKNYADAECSDYQIEIANDIISNPVIRALLNIYRAGAKSVHAILGFPLFLYLVKKDLFFMLVIGQNEEKAIRLLSDIQAELKFNESIKYDYGNRFNRGDWSEGNFLTKDGVRFQALGFGQDPRGLRNGKYRPDYIGCDDIDVLKRCNNDRLIREGMDYITSTLWGCFDKGRERFVFCNNLIHRNSFMSKLIELSVIANKQAKQAGLKKIFYYYKVPAVLDENFTPSWPQKYTAEYWRNKKASTPYRAWMREYMCTPLVDGAIFKPDYMQHAEMLPLSKYEALELYGDLSYKDKGDYKALLLVGKTGRFFHVIHAFVRQTSRANCAIWLYDLYSDKKLDRFNIRYKIEGLFAQDDFVNDFDTEGDRRGFYVPVTADKRAKGNKYDRIESMEGYFERRNVIFNIKEKDSPDQVTLIDQLLAFEKGSGANDDGPDCLQSAIVDLNNITRVDSFKPIITPMSQIVNDSKNRY